MTKLCKNCIEYIGRNLIRVLLFAVILSAGLMMNLVTKAKYVSYVNMYHHGVAGSFHFTSNYLDEEERTYTISDWDRASYAVTLRIQNFENSYLYNDAETSCYYCVEAVVYTDANYTQVDESFVATIKYQTGAKKVIYNEKEYAFLPGQSDEFDKTAGTQLVTVEIETDTPVESARYLKITASTMTAAQMKDAFEQNYIESIPKGPVFDTKLSAKFALKIHSGAVIQTVLGTKTHSSEVIYELRCHSTDGGASSKVKVFFNTSRLKFEDSLKYQVYPRDSANENDTYRYIELDVYSTSITKLMFFKRRMDDEITSDADLDEGENVTDKDIYYEIVTYED